VAKKKEATAPAAKRQQLHQQQQLQENQLSKEKLPLKQQ
jgi:hypothetical protein